MRPARAKHKYSSGFTLIEISIVLVIIGLIVGGVLVGQNLISATAVRAQISQIEKYNTAVNTFRGKYGYLPGDIKDPDASNFGFLVRGQYAGQGDGNGVIQSNWNNLPGQSDGLHWGGEITLAWVDLSTAHLIDGGFTTACAVCGSITNITATTSPNVNAYLPEAKIGSGNNVYIWSLNGSNYFGVLSGMVLGQTAWTTGNLNLTAQQAYAIDSKMDDGSPISGKVTAAYLDGNQILYPGYASSSNQIVYWPSTAGSATSCFDNGGVAAGAASFVYSTEMNSQNLNCALSFQFQ